MSKNFELLMEIEKDFGAARPEPHRGQERSAVPVPSLAALDLSDVDHEVVRLVQQVFHPEAGAAHRLVVFCGIDAANPSSTVCARTARSLAARTPEKVCLVDANPSPHGLMGLFGNPANAAGSAAEPDQCLPVASNLWLTRWSTTNGNGARGSSELRTRLAKLQREFGYVLIDAPGCAVNDEATVLGQASDAVILVIEAGATRRMAASKAKRNLEAAGVRLAGTVLHNRSFPIPKALYERL
jgi:Mrp family chromosome partitioning ATPase